MVEAQRDGLLVGRTRRRVAVVQRRREVLDDVGDGDGVPALVEVREEVPSRGVRLRPERGVERRECW